MGRVALIGENSVEYVEVLLDIWNAGDSAVLINYHTPPLAAVEMMLEAKVSRCYIEKRYLSEIHMFGADGIEYIVFEKSNDCERLLPEKVYKKFQNNYSKKEALVIYSSGTTGKSKGVILSHFAINTNADAIINYMQPCSDDCIYIVKSITHSSTITGELLVALKSKISLLLGPIVVPPRCVMNNISKYGVTLICVGPLLLSLYCNEFKKKDYNLSTLKKIYVSGSILCDHIREKACEVFKNQKIFNVYGLTEAGPRVTAQRKDCPSNSVGTPLQGIDITIVDDRGTIMQRGQVGIIHVNTPSIYNGYVTGGEKNPSLFQGWLNTGDLGFVDTNDELHIIGRIDDMIIIDSHKIYPGEIERMIIELPLIQECFVTKIELNKHEIIACLYIGEYISEERIREKLKKKLLAYEIPRRFIKCESIPMTLSGKIDQHKAKAIIKHFIEAERDFK